MFELPTVAESPAALLSSWSMVDELFALERVAFYLEQSDPAEARKIRLGTIRLTAVVP